MVVASFLLEKLSKMVLAIQNALKGCIIWWGYWAAAMGALEAWFVISLALHSYLKILNIFHIMLLSKMTNIEYIFLRMEKTLNNIILCSMFSVLENMKEHRALNFHSNPDLRFALFKLWPLLFVSVKEKIWICIKYIFSNKFPSFWIDKLELKLRQS